MPQPRALSPAFSLAVIAISPSSGPASGGTRITISGNDFMEGATVSLGDTPATEVSVTESTFITATTPPHEPGSVDVVVTNPDGQTTTFSGGYTYEPEPPSASAPTIESVTPLSGPAAGGTPITLSGSDFVEGATVSLGDAPATDVIVTSSMAIMATTPSHAAGRVDVVVTNPDGQAATLGGGYTYTADQPPTGATVTVTITSFGVSPKEVEVAVGSRVTFVNNDSRSHDIRSDPHPLHTDCPPVNEVGLLRPGESKETGQFLTARVCGYHDHSQSSNQALRGQISVR